MAKTRGSGAKSEGPQGPDTRCEGRIQVTGEVRLLGSACPTPAAVLRVSLLDTSLADAPALEVASVMVDRVAQRLMRGELLKFALVCQQVNPKSSYCLQAHIDQNGDALIKPGDWVSRESYPVITFGYPQHQVVQVVALNL